MSGLCNIITIRLDLLEWGYDAFDLSRRGLHLKNMPDLSLTTDLGPENSGLAGTLGYEVKDLAHAVVVARTTSGIVADGGGAYAVTASHAAFVAGFQGRVKWDKTPGDPLVYAVEDIRIGPTAAEIDTQLSGTHGAGAWGGISGGGLGARTISITINDGVSAIEGAKVRLTKAAESYVLTTNASGLAVDAVGQPFHLDDGTWTVVVTKALFTFSGTTITVDGDETRTYSMTQIIPSPSLPGYVTAFGICEWGGVVQNAIPIKIYQNRAYGSGSISDVSERSTTSNVSGYWEFTGLIPGAGYMISAGPELREQFQLDVPAAATDPYEVPSFLST